MVEYLTEPPKKLIQQVRMPESLHRQVADIAARFGRSQSAQIVLFVRMAMSDRLPYILPDEPLPKDRRWVVKLTLAEGEFDSLAALAAREKRSIPQQLRYLIRCGIHDLFAD